VSAFLSPSLGTGKENLASDGVRCGFTLSMPEARREVVTRGGRSDAGGLGVLGLLISACGHAKMLHFSGQSVLSRTLVLQICKQVIRIAS
jgi:hypothetical protein